MRNFLFVLFITIPIFGHNISLGFVDKTDSRSLNGLYNRLDYLCVRDGKIFTNIKPLTGKDIQRYINSINIDDTFSRSLSSFVRMDIEKKVSHPLLGIKMFEKGWGMYQNEEKGELTSEIQVSAMMSPLSNFSIFVNAGIFNKAGSKIDSFAIYDPLIDPDYILHNFGGNAPVIGTEKIFEVRTIRAYGIFSFPSGEVEIGRDKIRYGPGYRSNLFLSGFSQPFNFLYNIKINHSPFRLLAFNAGIEDSSDIKRIASQRVEFNYKNRIILGMSEAVLYTQDEFLKYINPLDLYYITQRRGKSNEDNLVGGADIDIIVKDGIRIYGEFFDDDFIIFKGGASKYGIMAGFQIIDPLNIVKSELRGEATYVPHWTYTHISHINAYTSNGIPMGFWAGSDCIDGYLKFAKYITPEMGFDINLERLIHGEGTLDEPWEDTRSTDFTTPSGIPDKRWIAGSEIFLNRGRIFLNTGVSYSNIENYKNTLNDNRNRITGHLIFSIKY